jgi:uncharacterized protein involved in exopolysaccharide biosynthesis
MNRRGDKMSDRDDLNCNEIDLVDYLKVIIKRKTLVLSVLFICIGITVIVNFIRPKIYEISMYVSPPSDEAGNKMYDVNNLGSEINLDVFSSQIKEELKLSEKYPLKIEIVSPDGKINQVTMASRQSDIETSIKILNGYYQQLTKKYEDGVEEKKQELDMSISLKEASIKEDDLRLMIIDKRIQTNLLQSDRNKERIKRLQKDIQAFEEKDDLSMKESTKAEKNDKQAAGGEQQTLNVDKTHGDMFYLELHNMLNKQKTEVLTLVSRNEKVDLENEQLILEKFKIMEVDIKQTKLLILIEQAKRKKNHNLMLLQPPQASEKPVMPKIRKNIATSAVLGLMMGSFIAFFLEFGRSLKYK